MDPAAIPAPDAPAAGPPNVTPKPTPTVSTTNDSISTNGDESESVSGNVEHQALQNLPASSNRSTRIIHWILELTSSKGIQYARVIFQDLKGRPQWIYRESVPDHLIESFLATKTMSGKARKRKPLKYFDKAEG